jgi:nucleotide-binding universal stress UspA family protein
VFSNVLNGVDGQAGGRDAIALARRLAASGARLTLAHVHPGGERVPRTPYDADFEAGQDYESLELLEREREATELDAVISTIASPSVGDGSSTSPADPRRHQPVGTTLVDFGAQADLLVVGSRSYGPIGRLINGSTSNYLERHARCPLLILPRDAACVSAYRPSDHMPPSSHMSEEVLR